MIKVFDRSSARTSPREERNFFSVEDHVRGLGVAQNARGGDHVGGFGLRLGQIAVLFGFLASAVSLVAMRSTLPSSCLSRSLFFSTMSSA